MTERYRVLRHTDGFGSGSLSLQAFLNDLDENLEVISVQTTHSDYISRLGFTSDYMVVVKVNMPTLDKWPSEEPLLKGH